VSTRDEGATITQTVPPHRARWRVQVLGAALGAALMLLVGCAGSATYREANTLLAEGKTDAGLEKLQEAVRLDPKNVEYRIALVTRRAAIVNRLVAVGDGARRDGRASDAESAYRRALAYEPDQASARQGLEALATDSRHGQLVAEADAAFKLGAPASYDTALDRLRPVLAENPKHKEAIRLKASIDEARSKELRPDARLATSYRKPVTLEFRDAPLKAVFDVIAKVSGLNFFFDKDIRADLKATILVKNTSIEDAVRLLLVTNQLEQKVLNDNTVLIYPNTAQKLKEYQTLAVRTFHLTNADVKAVSTTLKTIVKTKDLVVDERLGLIIMRDTPAAIRMAERIVALQDLSDPEVMLDVEIMEVKRSRLLELGVRWPTQLTLSPLQTATSPLTLNDLRNLNSSRIQADIGSLGINARKEDQDGNLLANPRIRVRNKEKAKILIGDRVPVITTTSTSTGFVSESVNYVDVGLKLDVEPTIYLDDEVAIKINLEVSSLVREVLSKSGTLSYQIGTRGASTVLRLKDGETQTLAGLINDEDRSTANKVPGFGELPVLGRLFGSQKDDGQSNEILLSITPRVVRSIRRPDLFAAEFESGTESSIGADSLRLSTVESQAPAKPTASLAPPVQVQAPGVAPPPATPTSEAIGLSLQMAESVKVGGSVSAVLRVSSRQSLDRMPLVLGFDPQTLQVTAVEEGDFFKRGNTQTNFSHRIDAEQGRVFATLGRQGAAGAADVANASGSLLVVTFKALKAAGATRVQVLSASPDPKLALTLPVEKAIQVAP
jgi:general secretion pathway protein D